MEDKVLDTQKLACSQRQMKNKSYINQLYVHKRTPIK